MAGEITKSDLIEDDALLAPLVLAENFETAYKAIVKLIAAGKEAGVSIGAATSTKELKEETEKLTEAQIQLAKIEKQIATLVAKDSDEFRKQQSVVANLNKTLKQKTVLGDLDAKQVNKHNASIKQLGAALDANRVAFASLRTEEERTSKEGKELLKIIQQQDTEFKELNGSIGKHQDNVGDYKGAIKDLKVQLKAAKDELAGIAAEFGTASPQFQEAAKRAGELNDELKDVQEVTNAFTGEPLERLGQSVKFTAEKVKALDFKGAKIGLKGLFDLAKNNPYLILAAVLIAIVGIIVALKDKIKPLVVLFNVIGNVIEDVKNKVLEWTDALGLTENAQEKRSAKFLASMEKEREALKQRYDDEIRLAEASHQNTLDLQAASARGQQSTTNRIISELQRQRKHQLELGFRTTSDEIKELDKRIAEEKKHYNDALIEEQVVFQKRKDLQKSFNEESRKLEQDRIAANRDAGTTALQNQLIAQKKIADAEGKAYIERVAATQKATDIEIQLEKRALTDRLNGLKLREEALKRTLNGDIDNALLVAKEIQVIEAQRVAERAKTNQQIEAINTEAAAKQRDLLIGNLEFEAKVQEEIVNDERESYDERIGAAYAFDAKQKEILDVQLKGNLITQAKYNDDLFNLTRQTTDTLIKLQEERIQKLADAAQQNANVGTDKELIALNESLANQDISLKEFTKRKEKILQTGYINGLTMQLKYLEQEKANLESFGINTTSLQQTIADTELAISDAKNAKLIEGQQLVQQRLQELQTTGFAAIQQIASDAFDAATARRQQESDDIATHLEIDLQLAGDNEAKKVELKNQAEAAQAKIRQQQAAADRKRALFEKATAAISIIINTAKGVGQALGTFPPPVSFVLAAVTAALGAIQLGVVLSKPIPQYAEGTASHPGGLAWIGDGGEHEIVKEPGKRAYISPNKPTLVDMARGTEVIPIEEHLASMALGNLSMTDRRGGREDVYLQQIGAGINTLITETRKNKPDGLTAAAARELIHHAAAREASMRDLYA